MSFRFYVTDTFDGAIYGTDDEEQASGLAESTDFFVVDAKANEWLLPGGNRQTVKNIEDEGV